MSEPDIMRVFTVDEVQQGGEAWENLRRIRPTASRFSEIVTAKKLELSKSAIKYIDEILAQQPFDKNPDPPAWSGNAHTDIGNEREAEAREAFTALTGKETHLVGFCVEKPSKGRFFGCSPDFLVPGPGPAGFDEGGEMKCPMSKTHMHYLLGGVLPEDHMAQVYGSMYVTGLRKWNFVSYFPGLPLFHLEVHWDATAEKFAKVMDDFRIMYADRRKQLQKLLEQQSRVLTAA